MSVGAAGVPESTVFAFKNETVTGRYGAGFTVRAFYVKIIADNTFAHKNRGLPLKLATFNNGQLH